MNKEEQRAAKRRQADEVRDQVLAEERTAEAQLFNQLKGSTAVRGRPSEYTDEEGDAICSWIAQGKSLRSYCRLEGRAIDTIYRWLRERPDFRERYARAHDDRADSLADELTDIADEVSAASMEEIQAAKLRIETRKWIASKLKPTKWGEQQVQQQRTAVTFNIGLPSREQRTIVVDSHSDIDTIAPKPAPLLGKP